MKKILSVCLALILLLACIPVQASADGSPTFAAGTVSARPGETVEIPILIENNPGIVGLLVSISFDRNVLTLQNAVSESLFSEGSFTLGGTYDTNTFKIIWENATGRNNSTESGTFAKLTFLVNEGAEAGETPITVSYSPTSVFDVSLNNVEFDVRHGSVTVLPTEIGGWHFAEGSTLRVCTSEMNQQQFVIGLDPDYAVVSEFVKTTGGWTYDIEQNDCGLESTGAKLVIYDETGTVAEDYDIVMFGDINGDGMFDGTDLTLLIYAVGYSLEDEPWAVYTDTDEFPQSFAADINHDSMLDGTDITCLIYQIGYEEIIDQTNASFG